MGRDEELDVLTQRLEALETRAVKRKNGELEKRSGSLSLSEMSHISSENSSMGVSNSANGSGDVPKRRGWPEPNQPEGLRDPPPPPASAPPPPARPASTTSIASAVSIKAIDEPPARIIEMDVVDLEKAPPPSYAAPLKQPDAILNNLDQKANVEELDIDIDIDVAEMSPPEEKREQAMQVAHCATPSEVVEENDVLEYAAVLGMQPHTDALDAMLLWVAAEGVQRPLPKEWCWHKTPEGEIYYIHRQSLATQWDNPLDEHYRQIYFQHYALLRTVMAELDVLSNCGWSLPLPMTQIVLHAQSFTAASTQMWMHRSWAVDEQEYAGEPEPLRLPNIPLKLIRDLMHCTVSPGAPGIVQLGLEENESGGQASQWLEVNGSEEDGLNIVFREHLLAPSSHPELIE